MDKLKSIFSSVLNIDPSKINNDISPQNTPAWDSLNAIVLVTEIEKAFSLKFAYDEIMNVKNFGDVAALLQSKGVAL